MKQELTYVYRLEDPTNGMAYIGSRCKAGITSVVDDDAYRGSVKSEMWRDQWFEISKRCEKTIIDVFTTKEEAIELEMKLHALYKVDTNPRFYNRARATSMGMHYPPPDGVSDATKAKTSATLKGIKRGPLTEEHRANLSAASKGVKRGPRSEETRAKISATKKGITTGPQSEETRANISAAQTGVKLGPMSDEHKASIKAGWARRKANDNKER